jgi:hypothetical protein
MLDDSPVIPAPVAAAFDAFPDESRQVLLAARAEVFAAASGYPRIGPLTETLTWGEPAYLTEETRSGSTLRLALSGGAPAMLVNCRTTLVEEVRARCADAFRYDGTRGILLAGAPAEAVRHAAWLVLTYHLRKR